jgi:hypothetical protein
VKRKNAVAAVNNETDPRSSGPVAALPVTPREVAAAPAFFPCNFRYVCAIVLTAIVPESVSLEPWTLQSGNLKSTVTCEDRHSLPCGETAGARSTF